MSNIRITAQIFKHTFFSYNESNNRNTKFAINRKKSRYFPD